MFMTFQHLSICVKFPCPYVVCCERRKNCLSASKCVFPTDTDIDSMFARECTLEFMIVCDTVSFGTVLPRTLESHILVKVGLCFEPSPKKITDFFCAFVLAPALFLKFGKVNPGPPQTDFFFLGRRGSLPTPPPSFFVSAGLPPQTDIFCTSSPPPPALFLTLGRVNCHRHMGGRGGLRLTFSWVREGGEVGGAFKTQTDQSPHFHLP